MNNRTPLTYRAADPVDVPAIVTLVQSSYRGDASRAGWTTEADLLDGQRIDAEGVLQIIGKPGACVLLAEYEGRLLACCHIERQDSRGYFGMFAVVPGEQGGGLGKAVLAEAERIAREEWHCMAMHMTVIEQRTELIAWYERRGYRRSGEFQPFPYGDERFGIPRRPDLRFEWLVKPLSVVTA